MLGREFTMAATNGVYQCNEWQYCVRRTAEREGHEIFTSAYARHVSFRRKEEAKEKKKVKSCK
jgi:hypothetical protein